MFTAQRDFQATLNPDGHPDIRTRIAFLQEMLFAAADELHEAANEMSWKSWVTSEFINERSMFGELRDAWQFIMNAMLELCGNDAEVTASRLCAEHLAKLQVNAQRHTDGYDGVTGKCPQCKRSLDEVETKEITVSGGPLPPHVVTHCVCGTWLSTRSV
jgi:hypothetical protein